MGRESGKWGEKVVSGERKRKVRRGSSKWERGTGKWGEKAVSGERKR